MKKLATALGLFLFFITPTFAEESSISDQIIFYQAQGDLPQMGPVVPESARSFEMFPQFLNFLQHNPPPDQAFIMLIRRDFISEDNRPNTITSILMYFIDKENKFQGWNIFVDKSGQNETKRVYVTKTRDAVMLGRATYSVLAFIDKDAIDPNLSAEVLDEKVEPYLVYLYGLVSPQ